jgi:mannosyltransferase PIG-V
VSADAAARAEPASGLAIRSVPVDAPRLSAGTTRALREVWSAFWTSRLAVWAGGMFGVLWLGTIPVTGTFDAANVTSPFAPLGNLLVAPAARWDSVLYLLIARDGYEPSSQPAALAYNQAKTAFYPLYPLLIHVGGWFVGSQLVAGILISLACFFVALVLLHRLAAIELGLQDARGTIVLLAFFPDAFYFSAVYTEALFLMLSVGALLAARQGRWAWAGIAGGLATLTRNSGILLLVPLLILYLYGPRGDRDAPAAGPWWRPRHPVARPLLWLGLLPFALALFYGYEGLAFGDPLQYAHMQQRLWYHHFVLLGGITGGIHAGLHELAQIVRSSGAAYAPGNGNLAVHFVGQDLTSLAFVAFALVGLVGVLRRLPFAYGAYVGVALLVPLSLPSTTLPLAGFARYVAVLFPLQMWMARWARERGRLAQVTGVSAVLLGLQAAEFARWGLTN